MRCGPLNNILKIQFAFFYHHGTEIAGGKPLLFFEDGGEIGGAAEAAGMRDLIHRQTGKAQLLAAMASRYSRMY